LKIIVIFHKEFLEEFWSLPEAVQDSMLVRVALIENFGQTWEDLLLTILKVQNLRT
jgi:hypothetical protein